MRMMLVRLRWPRRRRSCTEMMGTPGTSPLRRAERVLHCGPVHACPGRDGVEVKRAAPVRPAFVADNAHHGDLAPCEPGGHSRRQRPGCDEAAAAFDRGLPVGCPLP